MQGSDVKQLVVSARAGDREAYAMLVKQHYKRVFLICLGVLGNTHDAEDITQDVFVKGMSRLCELRKDPQFGAWVVRIATHMSINLLRRKSVSKRHRGKIMKTIQNKPSSLHTIDVQKAVETLPRDLRLPLITYYFDNQNVKQTAEDLNMSVSNVYQRLRVAIQQLHVLLAESGEIS